MYPPVHVSPPVLKQTRIWFGILIINTVEGTITITVALISMFILPDLPTSPTSSHLTTVQRDFAIWRLQQDVAPRSADDGDVVKVPGDTANGRERRIGVWEALRIVLLDGKTWMFCGILMSNCE